MEILEDLEEQLKELKEEGNQLSVLSGGPPIWNLKEEAVIDWYSEEELQIKIADARAMISDLHRIKFMAQREARELNRSRDAGPHRQDDMQEGSLHDVWLHWYMWLCNSPFAELQACSRHQLGYQAYESKHLNSGNLKPQ
jgi:hypothetical protein